MQKCKNAKERLSERIPKFIWGRPSVSSFDDGTSKSKICGVLAENVAFDGGHQKKFFTPLQAHGMGNFTAWRGRKFSFATQKSMAIPDKLACSNKILQNKRK